MTGRQFRYVVAVVYPDGVPFDMAGFGSADDALRYRDLRAALESRTALWMVYDSDDGERGYARWCGDCDEHAAFGDECEHCAAVAA